MVFNNGESVDAIYCEGVKVWPDITPAPGEYYVKWWPKSASGSFIMGGEARWLQDYNGYYSGPFLSYSNNYYIDSSAFTGNTDIYAIETNLPYIGKHAFSNCTSLLYVSASSCTFLMGNSTNQALGQYTFANCTSLLTVYMPLCSRVGQLAFYSCTNLRNVTLTSCRVLVEGAFYKCEHLPEITLPNCSAIDESVFMNCYDLSYVDLPICSKLHAGVFRSCSDLTAVYLGYSGVCSFETSVFRDTPIAYGSGSIFVPLEWVSEYKSTYSSLSSCIFPIPHN